MILFTGDQVRATLAGTMTQTRRPVKGIVESPGVYSDARWHAGDMPRSPFGDVGDLLYVQETWAEGTPDPVYRADGEMKAQPGPHMTPEEAGAYKFRWRSSTQMSKRHAHIWLRVTGVRVERVQADWEWVVSFERTER